ncbi:MAG: SRPBCC family protein, partial [Candidatus Thiodiazotropha taylori]|nr:SRPBCC family protein [Candidatus Thiodiazotropha taylori]MCG7973338.1 SRPBCC family protein [Candidatus Thiodiazotropha taylori]
MTTIVIVIVVVILAVPLIYLSTLKGDFVVSRSLAIGVAKEQVFAKIKDFRSWPEWSPWLMHEPQTRLEYSDAPDQQGGWYSWDGETVGAGRLTHVKFSGSDRIEQKIEFLRPFKLVSQVWWDLEPLEAGGTLVRWNMSGSMPFLFRFMTKKIGEYVGKDYDTGLAMLRGVLEPGAEHPRFSFEGIVELPATTALTIPFEGDLETMKVAMKEGFSKLAEYAAENQPLSSGCPFTCYHEVDLQTMRFKCDMCLPVSQDVTQSGFKLKQFPAGRYYKTTMKGSYQFLELAWYQAYS